jgi:hypothetical protein
VQTSIFLAKLIGPILLAGAIGMLANQTVYRAVAEEFLRSRALIYLSGLLTMAAGLSLVLAHYVWAADWRVLITILGWLAAIGGAVRIILPQASETLGRRMLARPAAMHAGGIGWLAVGAMLCSSVIPADTNAHKGAAQ